MISKWQPFMICPLEFLAFFKPSKTITITPKVVKSNERTLKMKIKVFIYNSDFQNFEKNVFQTVSR